MQSLIVKASSSDYTVEFSNPIYLGTGAYEIALKNIAVYNRWYNICEKFGNNKFMFMKSDSRIYTEYRIPDGNYSDEDLNAYFEDAIKIDVKILIIPAMSRFALDVGRECAIDLTQGSLNEILGFEKGIYTGRQVGQHVGNITRGVDMLLIHCNLVTGSRINTEETNVLYAFVPKAPPGGLISISEINPVFQAAVNTNDIQRLRIWVTDQHKRPIDFNDEELFYTLLLRKTII
jgi:hypothetical protein